MGETINRTIVFTHIKVGSDESVTSKGACENNSICEMMRVFCYALPIYLIKIITSKNLMFIIEDPYKL